MPVADDALVATTRLDVAGAENVAQDRVSVAHGIDRAKPAGIVEIAAVLAGRQRRHQLLQATLVRDIPLQPTGEHRKERAERQDGLILGQPELLRERAHCLSILRAKDGIQNTH